MASLLIIEDDPMLGLALTTTFEKAGYGVALAKDGDEGLKLALKDTFDLIFLDVMLPGKSGFEVLKSLKDDPKTTQIPVVMLTNVSQMEQMDRAITLGASDYIIKSNTQLDKLVELTRTKYC